MKIIGEKINGTRKAVAAAIANRDAEFIQNLAKKQVEGGAHWLDVNAGTHPDREVDDLLWLIDLIQGVTDVPLSLDSANPKALTAALSAVKKTPLINSISGVFFTALNAAVSAVGLALSSDNGTSVTP